MPRPTSSPTSDSVEAGHYVRALTLSELDIPKPLIAAVNGHALGGGAEIALDCDIRIASDNATFGLPEARWASVPAVGGVSKILRAVPRAVAMQMLLTGDRIDATEAHRVGLVSEVVPPDRLLDRALEIAGRIAANGPLAVRSIKTLATRTEDLPLSRSIDSNSCCGASCVTPKTASKVDRLRRAAPTQLPGSLTRCRKELRARTSPRSRRRPSSAVGAEHFLTDGTRAVLRITRCRNCATAPGFPARAQCSNCASWEVDEEVTSSAGIAYASTVVRVGPASSTPPYTLAYVDVDGVRLLAHATSADALFPGRPWT